MGWIPVGLAAIAAYLTRSNTSGVLFWLAVSSGVLAFWSYGIMHNRPYASATKRRDAAVARLRADGMSEEEIHASGLNRVAITDEDAQLAPDWAAQLNMVASLGSVVALTWAIIKVL